MVEIKTQEEFNNINNIIANLPPEGELIRIHDLGDNKAYMLNQSIDINRSNVSIEGYGASKPIIQSQQTETFSSMISSSGGSDLDKRLNNINIKNLNLDGRGVYVTQGIIAYMAGMSHTTGLGSGTYSRYDYSTVGKNYICKKGITIENCIIQNIRGRGIEISFSHNCIIKNNTIQSSIFSGEEGIHLYNSKAIIVEGNNMKSISRGIRINSSDNSIISNNVVTNNKKAGIYAYMSSNNIITNNISQNNDEQGIHLEKSENNIIANNNVQNNKYASIALVESNSNNVSNNIINNNNSHGIALVTSLNCAICDNSITSCGGTGVQFSNGGGESTVVGNTVHYNNKGIETQSLTDRVILYGNISTGNSVNNYNIGGTNNIYTTISNK